jgi:hypothetical protein
MWLSFSANPHIWGLAASNTPIPLAA